jgi:hypothetical protein
MPLLNLQPVIEKIKESACVCSWEDMVRGALCQRPPTPKRLSKTGVIKQRAPEDA